MTPLISLLVGVGVVLLITAFTAYFVAQEFAYMAVDRSQLGSRAADGDTKAKNTLKVTQRTSFMLSGAQLGITVTGLLVGYVAEPLIGQSLATMMGGGSPAAWSVAVGGVVAIGFSTIVQMLLGELFPKNYAIARSAQVADALTPSTRLYLTIFGPLIWVFDKAAELLLKAVRIEPVHDVESTASATDLERVVAASREAGTLSPELSLVIDRILDFPRRDVEHAMVPRVQVDTVRDTTTIAEVRALMATGHTRYPVLDADEQIVGVVHLVDVLDHEPDADAPVATIAREGLVLPEFLDLPSAQDQLRQADDKIASVVDEFGSFIGIITLEDMAEEIVGEIIDEHDPDDPDYLPETGDGVWVMGGSVHVDELERALGLKLPTGEYQTIAGLLMATVGNLPDEGDVIDLVVQPTAAQLAVDADTPARTVRFEVLALHRRVPGRVRVTLPDEGESA